MKSQSQSPILPRSSAQTHTPVMETQQAQSPLVNLLVSPRDILRSAQELQSRGFRVIWIDNYNFTASAVPADFDFANYSLVEGQDESTVLQS